MHTTLMSYNLNQTLLVTAFKEIKPGTERPARAGYMGAVAFRAVILTWDLVGKDRGFCNRLKLAVRPQIKIFMFRPVHGK